MIKPLCDLLGIRDAKVCSVVYHCWDYCLASLRPTFRRRGLVSVICALKTVWHISNIEVVPRYPTKKAWGNVRFYAQEEITNLKKF